MWGRCQNNEFRFKQLTLKILYQLVNLNYIYLEHYSVTSNMTIAYVISLLVIIKRERCTRAGVGWKWGWAG